MPGASLAASRWAATTKAFSSVARTASTAAREFGRPTDRGMNRGGKSTVFRSGKTGSVRTLSVGGFTGLLRGRQVDEQHAVPVLGGEPGLVEAAGQLDGPFKA